MDENPDMPIESHLLHLADRICASISESPFILAQVNQIKEHISINTGNIFVPEYMDAFIDLADKEYVWLDLVSTEVLQKVDYSSFDSLEISIDELIDLARIYSYLIDFRSHFTATHSARVAKVAENCPNCRIFQGMKQRKCSPPGIFTTWGNWLLIMQSLKSKKP